MSRGAEKTRVPLLMRDRSFYHTFLILAGTLILEQAVVLSVNLADNLMIGSYNETALAAVAAVNQIVFVVQQVIYGVTNGVIVLSSQYWGKQQTAPIRRLVCLGLRLEAALSMLFFAVVSLWPAQCVGLFVTDAAIIAEGVRYLRVIRFTFPFFAVTTVLLGAMRSVETVSLALKVSVVSLVTNCVINYILIFGRFGAPELGVVGAAIGTLAARTLECGIVCVYVFCRDRKLQLRAAELGRSDPALRGDYFRTSVPIVLQAAMWGVRHSDCHSRAYDGECRRSLLHLLDGVSTAQGHVGGRVYRRVDHGRQADRQWRKAAAHDGLYDAAAVRGARGRPRDRAVFPAHPTAARLPHLR